MLETLVHKLKTEARVHLAKKYKTIMSPRMAKLHFDFANSCKQKFKKSSCNQVTNELRDSIAHYKNLGFSQVWNKSQEEIANSIYTKVKKWEEEEKYWNNGTIELTAEVYNAIPEIEILIKDTFKDFIQGVFNSHYKVFFARVLKTSHDPSGPNGSQLWHQDGGPGSALNALFYLRETNAKEGAIELISWEDSLKLFKKVILNKKLIELQKAKKPKIEQRNKKVSIFTDSIKNNSAIKVHQPTGRAGLFVPFQNNLVHKGGYPLEGQKDRYALLFYFYPSETPVPIENYKNTGFPKTDSFPKNPKF